MMKKPLLFFAFFLFLIVSAMAQPQRELRAVWLSSVFNIDWPHSSSATAQQQKNTLINMLNTLQNTNINAVFFQVRPNADALYNSNYEPWSQWITGTRGQVPSYDPLAFVIQEANKRGMEVHAWLNPYRYENTAGQYSGLPGDYMQTHPELMINYNSKTYFNPGIPATTKLIKSIVADLISNYDLDGVIFDDYFYPSGLPNSYDQNTYDTYGTDEFVKRYYSTNTRGNFRRASVNNMIKEVNDTIKSIKPQLAFGVSPFGIYSTQASAATHWGTTLPPGITGWDAYNAIYCDPLAWLNGGYVDYLSPQLYWPHGGAQDYLTLVNWWSNETSRKGRHLYPSIASYKLPTGAKSQPLSDEIPDLLREIKIAMLFQESMQEKFDKADYTLQEIENQILANRNLADKDVLGVVFFSTKDLTSRVPNLAPYLASGVFSGKSVFPYLPWLPSIQGGQPVILEMGRIGEDANLAAMIIANSPANRFLLYGWEEQPAKKSEPEFMQLVFGRDFSLFYPKGKNYFVIREFHPNREIGYMSASSEYVVMAPTQTISPNGGVICHNHEFSWAENTSAHSYQLLVMNQRNQQSVLYSSPAISETSWLLPSGELPGQEDYIYRVKAYSDDAVSFSAPKVFSTGYPLSTKLNAPFEGAANVNLTTTFQWTTITGVTAYQLQVAIHPSFGPESLVIDKDQISGNITSATLVQNNTKHYARVRGSNACGFSAWSNITSFTTTLGTSVSEAEVTTLKAFPNPAQNYCEVVYPHIIRERTISWYAVNGKLVKEYSRSNGVQSESFDTSSLPPGFYTVMITSENNNRYVFKVIRTR